MKITDDKYFKEFKSLIGENLKKGVNQFDFSEQNSDLIYQTQASAVYSSNIEGNSIDLNSFMNYELSKEKFKPQKELKEIEDLILAYQFAQKQELNQKTLLKSHKILSKQLLINSLRGNYRNDKVGVFDNSGLVYLAIEAEFLPETMKLFFDEIAILLSTQLELEEVFYYASLIHLRFVHIHPFRDGNGRTARLLEKWFLAQKLGLKYWKLPSEKMYKENQSTYYTNINLGINFYALNYDKCLPFLTMLPNSLK